MSQLKALVAGLVQNPGLLRSFIEDPQGFARLAGLGAAESKAAERVGHLMSDILNRFNGPSPPAVAGPLFPARSRPAASRRANGSPAIGGHGVAITGIVSLVAVAGAVAALGTVSLVALVAGDERTP
jgi:hypothetical protein